MSAGCLGLCRSFRGSLFLFLCVCVCGTGFHPVSMAPVFYPIVPATIGASFLFSFFWFVPLGGGGDSQFFTFTVGTVDNTAPGPCQVISTKHRPMSVKKHRNKEKSVDTFEGDISMGFAYNHRYIYICIYKRKCLGDFFHLVLLCGMDRKRFWN